MDLLWPDEFQLKFTTPIGVQRLLKSDISPNELRHPILFITACTIGMSVAIAPLYLATFQVFVPELQAEFGWTRGSLSTVFAVTALAIAIATPIFSAVIHRIGTHRLLKVMVLVFGLSVGAIAFAPDNFTVYLILSIIIGLAGAGTNTFVYVSILPQWFDKRLGLVLGLTTMGTGIGISIMTVVAQLLISEFGWRGAYLGLGTISVLISMPMVLFFIKDRKIKKAPVESELATKAGAYRSLMTPTFVFLGLSYFLIAMLASGIAVHGVSILRDNGFSAIEAASIAASGGVSVIIGRVCFGYLLDIWGPRFVATVVFSAAAVGVFGFSEASPQMFVYIAPVFLGLAIGAEGDLIPFSSKQYFAPDYYPIIYGWFFTIYNLGAMTGPVLMGLGYDASGDYETILTGFIVSALIAVPTFWVATLFAKPSS